MDEKSTNLNEAEPMLDFVNLAPEDHRFGVDVNLQLMQPGKNHLTSCPMLRVYKRGLSEYFFITISDSPVVQGDWQNLVNANELKKLISSKIKHKGALLKLWNDPRMTTRELLNKLMFSCEM